MNCQTVRTDIHIEPTNAAIHAHLEICAQCASYAERMSRLDRVVASELIVSAPAAVTAELRAGAMSSSAARDRLDFALRDELLAPVPAALTAQLQSLVLEPVRAGSVLDLALRDELLVQAPPALTARLQALVPQAAAPVDMPELVPVARPRRWVVATVYVATAALLMLSLMYAGQIYSLMITQLGLSEWLTSVAGWPADLLNQLYTAVPQARIVVGALVRIQQPLQWLLIALVMWAVVDMSQRQGQRERQYA